MLVLFSYEIVLFDMKYTHTNFIIIHTNYFITKRLQYFIYCKIQSYYYQRVLTHTIWSMKRKSFIQNKILPTQFAEPR